MIFRIFHRTLGGHVHIRLFAGKTEGALGSAATSASRPMSLSSSSAS